MNKSYLVDQATNELDDVTKDGFFGNVSQELLKKKIHYQEMIFFMIALLKYLVAATMDERMWLVLH